MTARYFQRVHRQTPTRFWINNPTRDQADWAIREGAVGCTLNPSYCQKMIDHPQEGSYAREVLDQVILETANSTEAEVELQRRLAKPILEKFWPLYQGHPRQDGYVSLQGDPIHEEDPDTIIQEALGNRALAENVCCKVPTTAAGLKAMEVLMAEDIPINATEVMGIRQAIDVCELYERVTRQTGKHPKLYVSHIAGIYDQYLKGVVDDQGIDISPDVLWQAGLAIARKLYDLMQERGYHATFIGGGARGLHHFTEMVGGDVVVTINWEGTADTLLEMDPPVVYRLFNPVQQKVIDELMEKLPDFKRGYLDDGLEVDEYEDFGPVMLFRSSFIKSWKRVLELAEERKAASSPTAIH